MGNLWSPHFVVLYRLPRHPHLLFPIGIRLLFTSVVFYSTPSSFLEKKSPTRAVFKYWIRWWRNWRWTNDDNWFSFEISIGEIIEVLFRIGSLDARMTFLPVSPFLLKTKEEIHSLAEWSLLVSTWKPINAPKHTLIEGIGGKIADQCGIKTAPWVNFSVLPLILYGHIELWIYGFYRSLYLNRPEPFLNKPCNFNKISIAIGLISSGKTRSRLLALFLI